MSGRAARARAFKQQECWHEQCRHCRQETFFPLTDDGPERPVLALEDRQLNRCECSDLHYDRDSQLQSGKVPKTVGSNRLPAGEGQI
jgi:hypothetical protein